jgi:hypothetical protein
VAASVTANILHAQPNPISQAIAAWPPLALLLTVELISRVPVDRRSLAFARLAATATIAGIAAWVSYWHMAGVASRYGETGASPYLLPLSVDGLIIVASVCLVELAGRIAAAETEREEAAEAVRQTEAAQAVRNVGDAMPTSRSTVDTKPRAPRTKSAAHPPTSRQRRAPAETAALAAAIEAVQPDATDADVARQLGISTSRLRTIRRETRDTRATSNVRELEPAA